MFDTLVIFLKDVILENPTYERKNQQTKKHYKHDELIIWQRVNEFIENIMFHLAIENNVKHKSCCF